MGLGGKTSKWEMVRRMGAGLQQQLVVALEVRAILHLHRRSALAVSSRCRTQSVGLAAFPDFTFLRSTIRKITFHSFESISCAQTNKCRGRVCAAQRQCSPILCTPWISAVYQRPKVQLAPAASLNRTNTRYMGYRLCGTSEHAASARNRRNCIRLGVNTRRELIAIFDATVE